MRCRGGKIVGEDDGEDEVGFKLGRRMIVRRGELEAIDTAQSSELEEN